MKNTWTIWLLSGALLASLHWNLRHWLAENGSDSGSSEAVVSRCEIDLAGLGLTEEQQRELEQVCRLQCSVPEDLEQRADVKLRELRLAISRPDVDEAVLRALVREVSGLRERSLASCVDAVLSVRAILNGEQLQELMAGCASACDAGLGACGSSSSTE